MNKKQMAWEKEKQIVPIMIRNYCRAKHGKELCDDCKELIEYALFRLDKCPYKIDKHFCSTCKTHCYKKDMREKIIQVMKYSGPRLIFTNPSIAIAHVIQTIKR